MSNSVGKHQSSVSTGLLVVGVIVMVIAVLASLPMLFEEAGSRDVGSPPLLLGFACLTGLVGSAFVLVALIAKGVALGIRESRDGRTGR